MKFSSRALLLLLGATTVSYFPAASGQALIAAQLGTVLFESAAKAAGGKLGETGAGYALSAIGLGGGQYTKQLDGIQKTLTGIDSDLEDIRDFMGEWMCQGMAANLQEAEKVINTKVDHYNDFLTSAKNGKLVSKWKLLAFVAPCNLINCSIFVS